MDSETGSAGGANNAALTPTFSPGRRGRSGSQSSIGKRKRDLFRDRSSDDDAEEPPKSPLIRARSRSLSNRGLRFSSCGDSHAATTQMSTDENTDVRRPGSTSGLAARFVAGETYREMERPGGLTTTKASTDTADSEHKEA